LHVQVQALRRASRGVENAAVAHRSTGTAFLLPTLVVSLLAAALAVGGVVSYRSSQTSARAGLRARLQDRAFALAAAGRRPQRRGVQTLQTIVDDLGLDEGGARFADPEGRVLASSSWIQIGTVAPLPRFDPETGGSAEQELQGPDGAELEVCVPVPAPTLAGRPEAAPWNPGGPQPWSAKGRPAWDRGEVPEPLPNTFACAAMPLSAGLVGVTTARLVLLVSLLAAVGLLALAMLALRATRREAELGLRLERRQRLASLGELAALLAHEIRTPLAALRGFAQILDERAPDEPRLRDPADRIVSETDRLGRLVDELLSYARPAPPSFADIDVAALTRETAERMARQAAALDVRLLCEAVDPVRLRADPSRLEQVLSNLVRNAVEHSPTGATVLLRVEAERGQVRLSVADRGPGIDPAVRPRIFEPFFTTRAEGTGLGLAVCRRIADEHEGVLSVSERAGGGSEFTLSLPATGAEPE